MEVQIEIKYYRAQRDGTKSLESMVVKGEASVEPFDVKDRMDEDLTVTTVEELLELSVSLPSGLMRHELVGRPDEVVSWPGARPAQDHFGGERA